MQLSPAIVPRSSNIRRPDSARSASATSRSEWPWCSEPKVEGKTNPPKVANPAPEFSWQYDDPEQRPQSAFHLLVATSAELLDQNVGDLWDSGVVLSDAHQAKYQGVELGSETTYFWKVRVRNSEGRWSEQW